VDNLRENPITDEEAAALEGISADCLTNWRKSNPEFYGTIKWAEAERLKGRLARIERGEPGWLPPIAKGWGNRRGATSGGGAPKTAKGSHWLRHGPQAALGSPMRMALIST
jgi:hypothetical protein